MKPYAMLALAATSIVLVGCDDDDDDGLTTVQPTALVRVVNASSTTSTADVFVGTQSTALGTGIAAGSASTNCLAVPAGTQSLNFRQGGGTTNVATGTPFNFVSGQRYTAILTGTGTGTDTRQVVVLTDQDVTAPAAGQNAIRFFNATGTTGNIYVTAPGATLGTANQTGLTSGTATTGGTGGFSTFPTGSTQVRVFPTGAATTGTPTVNFTIPTLTGNRVATVVLTGGAAGAQAFVVTPCS
jgi:hypothetical protein